MLQPSWLSREVPARGGRDSADIADHEGHLHFPCSKDGGDRCRLLEHRRVINTALIDVGLELREDKNDKSGVCIGLVEAITCGCRFFGLQENLGKKKALDLVEYILANHHCLTAIELSGSLSGRPSLLAVLKNHRSLKNLTVWGKIKTSDEMFVMTVIKGFSQIDKLAFKIYDFEKDWYMSTRMCSTAFDLRMHQLSSLDVGDLIIMPAEADELFQSLMQNKSITDLTVGLLTLCYCDDDCCSPLFVRYLEKHDSTLKKLTLKSHIFQESGLLLTVLIDTVCRMTSLEELNADFVMGNDSFMEVTGLFSKVATQSATVRRLTLPSMLCECYDLSCNDCAHPPDADAAECMEHWLTALRMPDLALNALSIDLRGFGEAECRAFVGAIADNNSLKSVTIHSLTAVDSTVSVCRAIREHGLTHRVTIGEYRMALKNINVLSRCPEINTVTLRMSDIQDNEAVGLESISTALQVLRGCDHVNTLRVICDIFYHVAFSALTACIRGLSALTDIDIDLRYHWALPMEQGRRNVEAELLSALTSKSKLIRVKVKGTVLCNDDLKLLEDVVHKSPNLIEVHLTPECVTSVMHKVNCLRHADERCNKAHTSTNILLVSIQETARRNASLVRAAARYVLDGQDEADDARAFEFFHNHPHVLKLVREGAHVTKAEAEKMVKGALWRMRHCSLDHFMRLAGVVKGTVECVGASKQLTDLNRDCWLRVRSFLKIDDVASASTSGH
ncbi:uncharacterized protein LOC119441603 isoform X2 [Dermacentor silvarum]|uniref:uncharacterized protein LOC119441603 isoform X2 n=1 Tax=Dermacentor silvarum TaxID=543639 RepID=UPI00210188E8|nr:uncharacterized protein LOC119441603 isoform X2 [Dermacentor silvarum]